MTKTALQRTAFRLRPLAWGTLTVMSGAAWAQGAGPSAAVAPVAAATAAAAGAGGAEPSTTSPKVDAVETVHVTANRRRERAKDVAGSVNVLGGGQLERIGATSIDEVAGYVPGLQVTGDAPGLKRQSMRGITTGASQIGASVATYMDEQPISLSSSVIGGASYSNDVDPLDLERIEVLKGPQGSLYGASALGGLIKYVTVSPDLKDFGGRAELGYTRGRDDGGLTARVALNVPISTDLFAIRVSAYSRKDPGYVKDTLRGRDDSNAFENEGARLSALFKPSAKFDARLVLDKQTLKSDDAAVPQYEASTLKPLYGVDGARRIYAQPLENSFDRGALTLNYDLGFAALLSVTSYARIQNDYSSDYSAYAKYLDYATVAGYAAAGLPVASLNPFGARYMASVDTEKKVQEFRLTSPGGGRFDWLLGVFLQEESTQGRILLDFESGAVPGVGSVNYLNGDVRSKLDEKAVYANGTYRFNDRLDVQAGFRYTSLRQDYSGAQQAYSYLTGGSMVMPTSVGRSKENQTTWLLSPRWALSRDDMVYLRAASGYRPGGPNVPDALGQTKPPFESDSIVNYEAGYKGLLRSVGLDLNAALFRIDWKDIQLTAADATSGSAYYTNGGKARSEGVELELGWRPVAGLRTSAALSAMRARLLEDVPAVNGLAGDDMPYTPKVSGSLAVDYEWSLGSGQASVGGTLRHVGRQRAVFSHQPAAPLAPSVVAPTLQSYELLDLRASYNLDRWTASLFVKNALNKRAPVTYTGATVIPDVATGRVGPATVGVTAPRTVGVYLRADF